MIGTEASPGRFERFVLALPEGAVLRGIFLALLALSVSIVVIDYRDLSMAEADEEPVSRTQPVPLEPPGPGDQIRPYLPKTIPVGPDRGEPTLPGYDGPVDGEAMAQPMRFILAGDGDLTALGRIDIGTAEEFRAFLESHKDEPIETVHLHSPGGSVEDAIEMARLVRARGLDTEVPADGYCASACPLLFAGGVERRAGEGAWIGLHQVYAVDMPGLPRDLDRSISGIQMATAECQELLVEMGVKPEVWIKAMRTPPEELYVLTEDELLISALVSGTPAPAP